MALSFPPSPAIGDIYLQWQWNGSAWGPISGGAGSGGSVSITAGTGVTVSPSPLTGTGTVALSTPVAISAGGTNATTAGAGADNLHGFSGATAGLVRRTGSATYALDGASYLTANQTLTLSGDISGSGTTAITTTLATVPIAKGGSGQTTAGAAFNAIAASGGTVGGNLSVAGNISASGQLRLGGASADTVNLSGVYTGIYAPDGSGSVSGIIQGTVASGGRTYYRNNVHQFDNAAGTATYGTFGSGNLTLTGTLTVNAGTGWATSLSSNNGVDCVQYMAVTGTRQWLQTIKASGEYWVYDVTGAGARIIISTTGSCQASSTWAVISDNRLKEDVQPYGRGLAEILPLEPIMYTWNGKGGVPEDDELHYGLAAQQVEEVMPELIREHEYVPPAEGREGDEPMTLKTYSPTDLTFALINACKELHERLTAAEAKLTSQGMKH